MGIFDGFKKRVAYHLPETAEIHDPTALKHIQEVEALLKVHAAEVQILDGLTKTQQDALYSELINRFGKELKIEYPLESSEMHNQVVLQKVMPTLYDVLLKAFRCGYMMGRGWITKEQRADYTISIGDSFASEVRNAMQNSRSRGFAFGSALTSVAAAGASFAIGEAAYKQEK